MPAHSDVHHILKVEDCEDDALLAQAQLRAIDRQLEFRRVETADEMQAALAERDWDLVISDDRLPGFDAIRAFNVLRRHCSDVPFIIMSGTMPEETAAFAMRLGADDERRRAARLATGSRPVRRLACTRDDAAAALHQPHRARANRDGLTRTGERFVAGRVIAHVTARS